MPFIHTVTFKWKADAALTTAAHVTEALTAMIPQLQGVQSYLCGPDIGLTPSAYDYAVVGTFITRSDFENYRDHPEHQRILRKLIVPQLDRRTVVQLES
jgi:stress responsive alpha/beta barrel protein